ncbi:hypothetical protein [Aeromonas enteropelogenes]|uniref:hypothetical protein n=1 Tax=Aeromonas enteropelogenes TaxID=29489 RepID=UPI0039AF81FF
MKEFWLLSGMILAMLMPVASAQESDAPVRICLGNGSEWPPYTYWVRHNGVPEPERLTGAAATLVLDALRQNGLSHQIRYLPWARVKQELVDYGQNGLCELTWDASYKPELAAHVYYSVPLYHTRLGLFYLKRRFPEAPDLEMASRGRMCGLLGYNYAPYGINKKLRRVKRLQQALDLLARGRCDFLPNSVEPLLSGLSLGIYQSEPGLTHLRLPNRKGFYLMVSKGSPRARELITQLDQTLVAFEEEGHTGKVMAKFLPPLE